MSLHDTVRRFNVLKTAHAPADLLRPRSDDGLVDAEDEALARMLASTGVGVAEARHEAHTTVDAIVRELRRAGHLRGANTAELRAALYTAWIDGLGVGLHHER